MKTSKILAPGLLALSLSTALADELPTVYVSASRVPEYSVDTAASIQVIDRKEIEASGANNVADVLRGRAGVYIADFFGDGSTASIDMRGFGGTANSNVLVLLDGRRLNPSTDASSLYLDDIPLNQVERIEVIHGSSGVLFGNQAVGGVINVITRKAEGRPDASVTLETGSYNRHNATISMNQPLGKGLSARFNGRLQTSDNYRDHNDTRTLNANLLLDYHRQAVHLFFEQRYLDDSQQTPGALFLDELAADRRQSHTTYANDFIDTRSNVSRVGGEYDINDDWLFAMEAAYRRDRRDFLQNFRIFTSPRSLQKRRIVTLNPRLHGAIPTNMGDLRLTLGADFEKTDYLINALLKQQADQRILAAYTQAIVPLGETVDLTLGARHARVYNDINHDIGGFAPAQLNLDDDVTIGSFGLSYRPDSQWRWFARANQNYRFAKLEEHTQDLAASAPPFKPKGIQNQKGLSLESGFEFTHDRGSLMLQIYRLKLDNEITYDASRSANINLPRTIRHGLNLSVRQEIDSRLSGSLDLDVTSGKVTAGSYDGKRIPQVPTYQIRLGGQWRPDPGLLLDGELLHVSNQVLASDYNNSFRRLDAYTVVNLNGRYQYGDWTFDARINNLFDTKYSEYGAVGSDNPGSGHPECIAGGFSDNCPAFYPAPERNFWIGAKYRFR